MHISREIQRIIDTYDITTVNGDAQMQQVLWKYSQALDPWALKEATRIYEAINLEDLTVWKRNAQEISRGIRNIVENTKIGEQMREFVEAQRHLISTLPIEAGQRAQALARDAMMRGERAESIISDIRELGNLSEGRARCIARTEISKAQSILVGVRGEAIGCTHYIWETAKDGTFYQNGRYIGGVRPTHAHMQGKVIRLDKEPEVEPGKFYHAGCIYNCRCWRRLIIPDTRLYEFHKSNGLI